jgi:hypothetical protein
MAPRLVRMEPEQVTGEPGAAWRQIQQGATLLVRAWWSPERAQDAAERVLAASDRWVADFDGKQHCLGRAWYTHLETGRSAEYFREAPASDVIVETAVPGLQSGLREAMSAVVGEPVLPRARWAGAGVHIFPAGGVCARDGGCVHFDHEGLTRAQLGSGFGALSLVLMLAPAASGGGLRLWDVMHGEPEMAVGEALELVSRPGDLVVFSSRRLHQIQPFEGMSPRVSATLHGAELGGRWESWF